MRNHINTVLRSSAIAQVRENVVRPVSIEMANLVLWRRQPDESPHDEPMDTSGLSKFPMPEIHSTIASSGCLPENATAWKRLNTPEVTDFIATFKAR
jgi:hypothetical protein